MELIDFLEKQPSRRPDASTYNSVIKAYVNKRTHSVCASPLNFFPLRRLRVLCVKCRLIPAGDFDSALEVYERMRSVFVVPDRLTFSHLLRGTCNALKFDKVRRVSMCVCGCGS